MTLQDQLIDAQTAYHKLMTGQSVSVYVDQNGERVEYSGANSAKLAQYIINLQNQIAGSQCGSGPMRVWF